MNNEAEILDIQAAVLEELKAMRSLLNIIAKQDAVLDANVGESKKTSPTTLTMVRTAIKQSKFGPNEVKFILNNEYNCSNSSQLAKDRYDEVIDRFEKGDWTLDLISETITKINKKKRISLKDIRDMMDRKYNVSKLVDMKPEDYSEFMDELLQLDAESQSHSQNVKEKMTLTKDDVLSAAKEALAEGMSSQRLKDFLITFGVTKVSELPEERYGEFVESLKEIKQLPEEELPGESLL